MPFPLYHLEHMPSLRDTRKPDGSGVETRLNISLLSTAKAISISLRSNPAFNSKSFISLLFKNSINKKKRDVLIIMYMNSVFDSKNLENIKRKEIRQKQIIKRIMKVTNSRITFLKSNT